ncbi:MAG: hypothetical protein F6K63_31240 [Moorea sp. SIO1G6]|uniref:hypothetical protein n=1 Tax=Moorena sp. SIO1G6 TaxID=2607840 RepID=UPI0013C080E8|nr:hypothetical protein [Moorena sp. SIO1G6]NET68630.1 hypothetical protein [Moorena sp. SIO1G6]
MASPPLTHPTQLVWNGQLVWKEHLSGMGILPVSNTPDSRFPIPDSRFPTPHTYFGQIL